MFLKNDNFMCEIPGSKRTDMNEYLIRFKGVFDTIRDGLDYIISKFGEILKKNNLLMEELADSMNITRININLCTKWDQMFLSQVV